MSNGHGFGCGCAKCDRHPDIDSTCMGVNCVASRQQRDTTEPRYRGSLADYRMFKVTDGWTFEVPVPRMVPGDGYLYGPLENGRWMLSRDIIWGPLAVGDDDGSP